MAYHRRAHGARIRKCGRRLKRARIAYVEHHGDIVGGGQFSLLLLMRHLQRFEAVCWCGFAGSMSDAVRATGDIPLYITPMPPLRLRHGLSVCAALWRLRRAVQQQRIDLLHANGSRSMFYAGLVGFLTGVPVVWHVRIALADGYWDRFLALWARRIVAISAAVRDRFAMGVHNKVQIVHNGVEVDSFARADPSYWREQWGEGPIVGMVAQLIPWKRQEDFIDAMALVARSWPTARFVLVGDEPEGAGIYGAQLRARAASVGLADQLVFTGFCPDIAPVFAALDVAVLCSCDEPFGRVIIEAMAAGKPVVATRGGGVPEIVVEGETGFMVAVADVEALAQAVGNLLADPPMAQAMGRAGQERVRAHFSVCAHVEKIESLYSEILGDASGAR